MRVKRLVVISVVIAAACKTPTPAEQMDSIQSWLATAEMVGESWLRHATPDKYSRETLELSHALIERLSARTLVRPIRRFLHARHVYSVYEVPWQEMDVTDPKRPVLRIAQRDMRRAK